VFRGILTSYSILNGRLRMGLSDLGMMQVTRTTLPFQGLIISRLIPLFDSLSCSVLRQRALPLVLELSNCDFSNGLNPMELFYSCNARDGGLSTINSWKRKWYRNNPKIEVGFSSSHNQYEG
jgi:hypothetical protein